MKNRVNIEVLMQDYELWASGKPEGDGLGNDILRELPYILNELEKAREVIASCPILRDREICDFCGECDWCEAVDAYDKVTL